MAESEKDATARPVYLVTHCTVCGVIARCALCDGDGPEPVYICTPCRDARCEPCLCGSDAHANGACFADDGEEN
jgi:hypothetical protein